MPWASLLARWVGGRRETKFCWVLAGCLGMQGVAGSSKCCA